MDEITKEMETKYLKEDGMICPFCGYDELSSSNIFWSSSFEAYAEVTCPNCKKKWKDLYSITGIREAK